MKPTFSRCKNFISKFKNTKSREGLLKNTLVGIKDNIVTRDSETTCASKMLEQFTSPFEATCVKELKNQGAVILGKCNLDEFAVGSHNISSIHGRPLNPLDPETSTGGSSGGSAAAVAAGECDISLGSDTGGSTRLPAAFCGIYGFKPSYGVISRYGLISYAGSLDTIGICSKNLELLKRSFKVLNKHDPKDMTSIPQKCREIFSKRQLLKNIVIGILDEANLEELDADIRTTWINIIKKLPFRVAQVSLPSVKASMTIYQVLSCAEFSSNMCKYSGHLFGYGSENKNSFDNMTINRSQAFGKDVVFKILAGNAVQTLTSDLYNKSLKLRGELLNQYKEVFREYQNDGTPIANKAKIDFLLLPTSYRKPPKYKNLDEETTALDDILTLPANLAGIPAVSFPVSRKISETTLPLGFQIFAGFGNDDLILNILEILKEHGIAN